MNPATNEVPRLNLPPPVMTPGTAASTALPAGTLPTANPLLPAVNLPVPSAPVPYVAASSVANTTANANPSIADDADLIEKEWVQKAKEIIKRTQNDPHLQSRELNIYRADYMQKRYNKVLKLSE